MTHKEKREARERMGLCTHCGGLRLNPVFRTCEKCRANKRNRALAKLAERLAETSVSNGTHEEIKSDHKCWSCVWSKFEGDRFFCPFPEGICEKEDKE